MAATVGIQSTLFIALTALMSGFSAQASEASGATLGKIKKSGVVTIGHRESSVPSSYIDEKKTPMGYQIDLCLKIVEALKTELALKDLKTKFMMVTPKTRIDLVRDGSVDMECGSTTNTLSRQKQVGFSFTTFITGTRLVAKKASKIEEIEGIGERNLAVVTGTTNEKAIKDAVKDLKLKLKVIEVKDNAAGFAALEKGEVIAFAADDVILFGLRGKAKKPDDFEVVGRFLSYDPYAIMVRRDDPDFMLALNQSLARIFRSGEIEKIYQKWFSPLGMPMSETLKAAIELQSLPE